MCLKETAERYGWDRVFPRLIDAKGVDYPGNIRPMPFRITARQYRGTRLRICRSKTTTTAQPAGLTNSFRVSNNATEMDLYALAQAVAIDYGWMTTKGGHRRRKADWDAFDLPDRYCHMDLRAADS